MRVNPRTVILNALKRAPGLLTLDDLVDDLWDGLGCNGEIGGRGISITRFCRLTFRADAILQRHLCHLERSGHVRRHTICGPHFRQTTYTGHDPATRRTIRESMHELRRLTEGAILTMPDAPAEYLELASPRLRRLIEDIGRAEAEHAEGEPFDVQAYLAESRR